MIATDFVLLNRLTGAEESLLRTAAPEGTHSDPLIGPSRIHFGAFAAQFAGTTRACPTRSRPPIPSKGRFSSPLTVYGNDRESIYSPSVDLSQPGEQVQVVSVRMIDVNRGAGRVVARIHCDRLSAAQVTQQFGATDG